jgi:NAD(P)-dependent dehydrogenase (short-subunit alcohol dehydrogenase family)
VSTVLITGARAPIALDLARSFAAAGHDAHLADSIRPWSARLSDQARGRLHKVAPPRFAFRQFADDLARLVDRLQPRWVIPTCEEVFYVAEVGARRGFADRVFAPAPPMLRTLHSKVDFAAFARANGVEAPSTARVTSAAELSAWRERSTKIVLKPEFSRFASHTRVRPSPRDLDAVAPTPDEPWAVQDFAAGEEICIWSASIAGEVVAFAAYKPRWRLGRSASFYFETDTDPALLALTRTLARAANTTGQLSFDVIRQANGALAPIECNPRGISGIHLFDGDARLARALLGEEPLQTPNAQARHLAPAMWLLGAPSALMSGKLNAFRRDLSRSRDVLSAPGERWLGLGALLDAGRFTLVGLSRGRSASGQSTDDIEWNGEPIA